MPVPLVNPNRFDVSLDRMAVPGITIDQVVARTIGSETPWPSLLVGVDPAPVSQGVRACTFAALPIAFCSAASRTEHVLSNMTSHSSSRVTIR